MKSTINYQRYSNTSNYQCLKADKDLYSISPIRKNNLASGKRNINMDSIDVEHLLDKTQHSIDEFIINLKNDENLKRKSYKEPPHKNFGFQMESNRLNHYLNNCKTDSNSNFQNISNYDKDIAKIIATQRKLLGKNREKYQTMINDISENDNRRIHREKTSNILIRNIKKTDEIENPLLINSYNKKPLDKRDISPIEISNFANHHEKSFDNKINKSDKFKIINQSVNKKNKLLIKENEKYKNELNKLKSLVENLKKENIILKQKLNTKSIENSYLSIFNSGFTIYSKNTLKNKEIISHLKKEIKFLKDQLNIYKSKENISNNNIPMEHDINIDQLEKMKKENNDLEKQNIFLITELSNIQKNQNFISNNNFLDKKNKSLNEQISNLKKKLKNYNNLQIYIKMMLQNKSNFENEKEQFLIRKIKEELNNIQERSKREKRAFQLNNNNFTCEKNGNIFCLNTKI